MSFSVPTNPIGGGALAGDGLGEASGTGLVEDCGVSSTGGDDPGDGLAEAGLGAGLVLLEE